MSVYDCFTFFNELDLLEIRLNVLWEVVDKFVLVEADRTFTNKEKQFYFEENKEKYKCFLDKIIHIKITKYPEMKDAWDMEYYQRNQIACGLVDCAPDDVVLISDLDEIPNPEIIKRFKENGSGTHKLEQVFFYYYLNYQKCVSKYGCPAKITRYKEITVNNYTPQKIRVEDNIKIIKKGGWHFSYLGGEEAIKYKIQSFAHQEYNNENYVNDKITNKIYLGLDIFDRYGVRFIPVKITNKKFPQYIVNNIDKYSHLIYQNINQYIIIKNTLYCLTTSLYRSIILLFKSWNAKIIDFIKIILPENIVNKIKKIKRQLHKRKSGT